MLMKSAVRCAIHNVALRKDTAAAFIKVDSPAAVTKAGNVVPGIVDDARARLPSERVNATHVAKDCAISVRFHSDMMHAVELDDVVRRSRRTVAPCPANRNSSVVKIVNIIV